MRVIATLIGAPTSKSRNGDVSRMFDYAFANCESKVILAKGDEVANEVKVKRGKQSTVKTIAESRLAIFSMRDSETVYTVEYDFPLEVKAKINQGDQIGTARLIVGGQTVAETKLIAAETIEKGTILDGIKNITDKW